MHYLRTLLRQQTASAHAAVDALYSTLDLTQPQDYRHFLLSNHHAFASLARRCPDPKMNTFIALSLQLLARDIARLEDGDTQQATPVPPPFAMAEVIDPCALFYVLGGAHFGKHLLHGRWAAADDDDMRAAGGYLQSSAGADIWKQFNTMAEGYAADPISDSRIITSANHIFVLFAVSFQHVATQGCGEAAPILRCAVGAAGHA